MSPKRGVSGMKFLVVCRNGFSIEVSVAMRAQLHHDTVLKFSTCLMGWIKQVVL